RPRTADAVGTQHGAARAEQVGRVDRLVVGGQILRPDLAGRPLSGDVVALRERIADAGAAPGVRDARRATALGMRLADLRRARAAVPGQRVAGLVFVVVAVGRREDVDGADVLEQRPPAPVLDVVVVEAVDGREVVALADRRQLLVTA